MDWSTLFPEFFPTPEQTKKHDDPTGQMKDTKHQVEFADIGCGYGGLLGTKVQFLQKELKFSNASVKICSSKIKLRSS